MATTRTERASGLPAPLARTPFGVLRPADAAAVYARPRQEFLRLTDRGVLHKLANGYCATVPAHSHDRTWRPSLEAAAYGIAAADYGVQGAMLMGLAQPGCTAPSPAHSRSLSSLSTGTGQS